MRTWVFLEKRWMMKFRSIAVALLLGLYLISANVVQAQSLLRNAGSYSLKSGESVEIMDVYFVVNCHSLLTSPPEVTVIDGPPGVAASLTEAMVLPRAQKCPSPVKGAKLKLSADKIEEQSYSDVTLRIRYKTKDGQREQSLTFNLALFP